MNLFDCPVMGDIRCTYFFLFLVITGMFSCDYLLRATIIYKFNCSIVNLVSTCISRAFVRILNATVAVTADS